MLKGTTFLFYIAHTHNFTFILGPVVPAVSPSPAPIIKYWRITAGMGGVRRKSEHRLRSPWTHQQNLFLTCLIICQLPQRGSVANVNWNGMFANCLCFKINTSTAEEVKEKPESQLQHLGYGSMQWWITPRSFCCVYLFCHCISSFLFKSLIPETLYR